MKPTKRSIKLLEIGSFCAYLAWFFFSAGMWGTKLMAENKPTTVFLLIFAAIIYILLCYIRKMPQIKMMPKGLTKEQATRIVRLRLQWVASLKLTFVCGFASIAISALFHETARVIFTILSIASLCGSSIYFLICCRNTLKKRLEVVGRRR